MPTMQQRVRNFSPAERALYYSRAEEFESTWQRTSGIESQIAGHLPTDGPVRLPLLVHCAKCDMEFRLQEGETRRVEEYVQAFAELAADVDAIVDLLLCAYNLAPADQPREENFARHFSPEVQALFQGAHAEMEPVGPWHDPDQYEVDEKPIGQGSWGVVYRAKHKRFGRYDAIKRVALETATGRQAKRIRAKIQRLRAEVPLAARLDHPNIVRLYADGDTNGHPYFIMEYCSGGTLSKRISEKYADKRMAPREAAALIRTLAEAADAVHRFGLIHRDLKPDNVLFTEDGVPKIADFGLALKLEPGEGAVVRERAGTPLYMAPEQVDPSRAKIEPATDVYGLGAILYECLTGKPPFPCSSVAEDQQVSEVYRRVCDRKPTPPRQLDSKISRDLEAICLKCLEKEPSQRYASAAALAEDLRRFQADEPVIALPSSHLDHVVKWARRNPAGFFLVLALIVIGSLSTFFAVHYKWAANREASDAEVIRKKEKATAEALKQVKEERDRVLVAEGRANQRFAEVRELARVFLFDVYDRLEKLPGSTAMRQYVADKGRSYLDKLAAEAGSEPELLAEVGQGYLRIGAALGDPRSPNLGKTSEALRSYQKGIRVLEGVGHVKARFHLAELFSAAGNILVVQGKTDDAVASYAVADTHLRELLQGEPQNLEYRLRRIDACLAATELFLARGRSEEALARAKEGFETAREVFRATANTAEAKSTLAQVRLLVARIQLATGDTLEALNHYEKALAILRQLHKEAPNDARHLAALLNGLQAAYTMGQALDQRGSAKLVADEALGLARKLADADPHNARAQLALALHLTHVEPSSSEASERLVEAIRICKRQMNADPDCILSQDRYFACLWMIGRRNALQGKGQMAYADVEAACAVAKGLSERDPTNLNLKGQLADGYALTAELLFTMGRGEEAVVRWVECLKIRREIVKIDESNAHRRRHLVVALLNAGKLHKALLQDGLALGYYKESQTHVEWLVRTDSRNVLNRTTALFVYDALGEVLVRQAMTKEAVAIYMKSRNDISIQAGSPGLDMPARWRMAVLMSMAGQRLNSVKCWHDAIECFSLAIQLVGSSAPPDQQRQAVLADMYHGAGVAHQALATCATKDGAIREHWKLALASCEQGVRLFQNLVSRTPEQERFLRECQTIVMQSDEALKRSEGP